MPTGTFSHIVGIDDAPFPREHRGDVLIVGAVHAGNRLEGVLSSRVRRDGINATDRIAAMVAGSRFASHLQLVMLQGIALAGFNVVDVPRLHATLRIAVLVVARRRPDLAAMRRALLGRVPGGTRKWRLIEQLGEMQAIGPVFVQRAGITLEQAARVVAATTLHGNIPEPLRIAHLVAGGIATGESRGRT